MWMSIMHLLKLLGFVIAGLYMSACATSVDPQTGTHLTDNLNQNWGFVLAEPGAFSMESLHDNKPLYGVIGYGGFEDEASCMDEAVKRLMEHPDRENLRAQCFAPFPRQAFQPYKVAIAQK